MSVGCGIVGGATVMDGTKDVGRDLWKTGGCIQQDVRSVTNDDVTWKRIRRNEQFCRTFYCEEREYRGSDHRRIAAKKCYGYILSYVMGNEKSHGGHASMTDVWSTFGRKPGIRYFRKCPESLKRIPRYGYHTRRMEVTNSIAVFSGVVT
jgi:hypothetical protein